MGLRLHAVAPRRGATWIKQAFAAWWKRPLAFIGLFVFFLFGVLLTMIVPFVGPVVGLGMLPMLTLGFMIATHSVLRGGPVNALQIFEGLRVPDRPRRNAQLLLCGLYALGSIAVIEIAGWVDEGLFEKLQVAMGTPSTPAAEINRLLEDPRLLDGMLVRVLLATLLSIPFWYAPALVHWGAQSAGQALFSSSVALWRTRGAFSVYALGWLGLTIALALLAMLAVLLIGSRHVVSLLAMPVGLMLTAVFYVSLWFSFADCFGVDDAALAPPP